MKRNVLSYLVAVVALCAGADEVRIRHMADTYLQSDGTQYIDTGYIGSTNLRVEVVFEPVLTNGTRYLFGSASNGSGMSPMKYGLYVQNGGMSFASGTGAGGAWGEGWFGIGKVTRSHYKAIYDYPKRRAELWSGDVQVYTQTALHTPGFETNNCTMTIFCNHYGPAAIGDWFGGKVYSFRLFDKGTLIRDMIPYGRGALTGLLDRCSGKVYTNMRSGGHPFILGTDDGYVRSDRAKNSGQFVNTGWCMTPQTKIEVDFTLLDPTTTWQCIFGALKGCGLLSALAIDGNKKFVWTLNDGDNYSWQATGIVADSARHTFTLDIPNATVTLANVEGTEYTGTISQIPTTTATTPLLLFGWAQTNETGTVTWGGASSVRIYGMRIWNVNTLVRDYEPRLVDNVEGLYDTVNNTFNTPDLSGSASTGKFRLTCGGNIISTSANGGSAAANADAYLQGTKSQGIQTDYYTSRKSRLEIDFSVTAFNGTDYFFGAVDTAHVNTNNVGLYYQLGKNGNRNLNFRHWNSANNNTTWPNIHGAMTPSRYKVVMDLLNAKGYMYMNGAQLKSMNLSLPSGDFKNTVPLRILSTQSDGNNCGYGRLYSFAVYEDDVLVHRYVPCVENGIAGVRDSVGKQFFGNWKTADGSGFTLHGAGMDGGGMVFTEQPQGGRLSRGRTLTLTAFAPGAAGYQWLKNGEIVEGATGRTLEATYGEGGTTDTYQCISYYALFGYGASEVAQVENLHSGTKVFLR